MNQKITFLLLVLLIATSCVDRQPQNEDPFRVKVARATPAADGQRKEFPFIARPLRTSELSFRVSGPIDRFEVYAGNHYKRDNIIAEIDPRDFRLRVENAEAVYRRAEADYKRIEALYKKNNVSAANYEQARAAWIAAKTAYNTALNELGDTQLRAPFDGYVGEVFIEKFQDVRAAQPVVTLVDISKLRIEVYVTQDIAMRADALKSVPCRCRGMRTQHDVEQPLLPAYGSAAQSGRKTSVGHIGQGVFRTARRNVPSRGRAAIGTLPPPFGRRFRMEDRSCDGDSCPTARYARRITSRRYNVRNIRPFGR